MKTAKDYIMNKEHWSAQEVFDAGEYTVVGTFKMDANGNEYVEYSI